MTPKVSLIHSQKKITNTLKIINLDQKVKVQINIWITVLTHQ
jgi:hypothetical protein